MADETAPIDSNSRQGLTAVSNADGETIVRLWADPVTHRLLVDLTGAGGVTIISVSGTINDSNVNFTALSEPTELVINGMSYIQTGGAITWTYVAGSITLSVPVGTGGSIYGRS